jgi:hypothetical protein
MLVLLTDEAMMLEGDAFNNVDDFEEVFRREMDLHLWKSARGIDSWLGIDLERALTPIYMGDGKSFSPCRRYSCDY